MEHPQYVDAIRREGAALVAAARTAGVDATVPSCPGWTVGDLLSHIGRIHHWVAEIVERRPADPPEHWSKAEPPRLDALVDYEAEGYARLADALADAGPDAATWTWTPNKTAGFWARRQAHEAAVHRWDAQGAAGIPDPIDRDLAVDGIQEVFDIFPLLPARTGKEPITGAGEVIHLHCTDGDGEWLIRLTPEGAVVTREHAKGDVAARGTASDLLLLMWGRVRPAHVETFGDAALLERWQQAAKF